MYDSVAIYIADQFRVAEGNPWEEASPEVQEGFLSDAPAYLPHQEINWIFDHPRSYRDTLFVVRDHERIDASRLFQSRSDLDKFQREHPEASWIYSQLQHFSPWLKQLCDNVETRSSLSNFATAFQTPPGQQALDVHWDIGPVVALQLQGKKRWWLWPPVAKSIAEIYSQRRITPQEVNTEPVGVLLQPGDALFLPRGWLHCATTEGHETSFHVSIAAFHSDMRNHQMNGYV